VWHDGDERWVGGNFSAPHPCGREPKTRSRVIVEIEAADLFGFGDARDDLDEGVDLAGPRRTRYLNKKKQGIIDPPNQRRRSHIESA